MVLRAEEGRVKLSAGPIVCEIVRHTVHDGMIGVKDPYDRALLAPRNAPRISNAMTNEGRGLSGRARPHRERSCERDSSIADSFHFSKIKLNAFRLVLYKSGYVQFSTIQGKCKVG